MNDNKILYGYQFEENGHNNVIPVASRGYLCSSCPQEENHSVGRIPNAEAHPITFTASTRTWDTSVVQQPGHNTMFSRDGAVSLDTGTTAPRPEHQAEATTNHEILVLGPTGVGKSSFIRATTGCDVPVGHSIDSCEANKYSIWKAPPANLVSGTTECKAYIATDHGVEYTLVDTPGFDDSSRDDMEILKSIAGYLGSRGRPSISGIIYLHRITDNRMTGTSAVNLQMLKKLCGELFYPHVTLVSTMWDKIPNEDMHVLARNREQQLIESDYWDEMVRRGSRIFQFHGDRDSGLNILRNFSKSTADKLPLPQLVAERNQGRAWEETSAGQIILEERHRREQKRIKDMAEEKAELEAEKAELQKEMRRKLRDNNIDRRLPYDGPRRRTRSLGRNPSESRTGGRRVYGHDMGGRYTNFQYREGRSPARRDRESMYRSRPRDRANSCESEGYGIGPLFKALVESFIFGQSTPKHRSLR